MEPRNANALPRSAVTSRRCSCEPGAAWEADRCSTVRVGTVTASLSLTGAGPVLSIPSAVQRCGRGPIVVGVDGCANVALSRMEQRQTPYDLRRGADSRTE